MTRGRKGTLKIPLGHVVKLSSHLYSEFYPSHLQPKCYGWKYLTALDALIDDKTVDTDYLSQSMSDMLDMTFSSSVSSIFVECEEALVTSEEMCPLLQEPDQENSAKCPYKCRPYGTSPKSRDCAYGEICCK